MARTDKQWHEQIAAVQYFSFEAESLSIFLMLGVSFVFEIFGLSLAEWWGLYDWTYTNHHQPQDLFNKYRPISFESTYIRTHKIPSRTVLTSFAESCCMSSLHNYVPIYLSFYLLELLMKPGSMRSSSSHVVPKGVHCIQTFLQCRKLSYSAIFIEWDMFPLLQATRLSGTKAYHIGFLSIFKFPML